MEFLVFTHRVDPLRFLNLPDLTVTLSNANILGITPQKIDNSILICLSIVITLDRN